MKWVEEHFKKLPSKPAGWVTVSDIVKQTGNNRKTIVSRLNTMIDDGLLLVMECKENGKVAKCYKYKK